MDQATWYYAVGNSQQQGPVDLATLQSLIAGGQVGSNDLVWRDGMADWVPASSVPELQAAQAAPAAAMQVEPQQPYAPPPPQYGQPAPQYQHPPIAYAPNSPDAQMQSKASTAMTLGIVSIVLSACVCGPAGLGLGIWAWSSGSKIPPGYPFSGQGRTGMICGIVGTILGALSTVFGIIYVIGIMASGARF